MKDRILKLYGKIIAVFIVSSCFFCSIKAQEVNGPILTPKEKPEPQINGPKIFGVRPGHPILFTIPATGKRPMTFSATNLPAGVKLNSTTGRISGSITKSGDYVITLQAKNALGTARQKFKIVVGEKVALTPPMGWNHYNIYGVHVNQEEILAQAKAMVSSGLINHGWSYINIDDGWQGKRGGELKAIMPDSSLFPDMQVLCNKVHDMGLKIGTYSTPWVESYGHRVGGSAMNPEGTFEATREKIAKNKKLLPYAIGTYHFWNNDVKQFAKWGFDYLKYDWNPNELPETKEMYDDLRASGRDILLSLSNSTPFASIAELSQVSNAWRTGGDIKDEWKSLKSRLFTQDKWAPYAGPGHWNDPDMMVLGVVGWNSQEKRPTRLTPDEQYTHMSAWCLMSVPLLLGNNLTKLDEFTLSLLTNDEVIAVNQDPLGKQATVISMQGEAGVMAKDMEDGSKAVGLFNPGDNGAQEVVLKWSDLGIKGRYIVRDLWRQKDLGTFEGEFKANVAMHGVVMVSLRKAK
ncbi:MAG TPA: putative Ig domain-containing protein [Bacteroidales bacterium]